jgi:hypothetical protein
MQVLHLLSHFASPLVLVIFEIRSLLYAQASLDGNPPIIISLYGWNDNHGTLCHWLRWGSTNHLLNWLQTMILLI